MLFPLAVRGRLVQAVMLAAFLAMSAGPASAEEEGKWETIFDGKTLDGWDGNPDFWSVEEGAITGQTTAEKPLKSNTFIIWKKGKVGDFELTLDYKIINGNSGIQYRSFEVPKNKWVIGGYQADFEAGKTYSGILYGERFRGILCKRGEKTELVRENGKFQVKNVGSLGDSAAIQAKIKHEDWNTYRIVAKGFHFQHFINDVPTADCIDNDKKERRADGVLALQLHVGGPMKVQFKNIKLKRTNTENAKPTAECNAEEPAAKQSEVKKVVLIAGPKSHGYGAHEHKAGCMLLAEALNDSGLPIKAEVVTGGWPKDESILDDADSIVIYADGGGGHPFNSHLEKLNELMKKGTGLVCIHYGVEVPKGASGDAFLAWTGGYFEAGWSVNPHWDADYNKLPSHAITRGVKPFKINDEWYYHMRFRDALAGVTPILSDLPPASTLNRPDGPHSGNPAVRKAVADGQTPTHGLGDRTRRRRPRVRFHRRAFSLELGQRPIPQVNAQRHRLDRPRRSSQARCAFQNLSLPKT